MKKINLLFLAIFCTSLFSLPNDLSAQVNKKIVQSIVKTETTLPAQIAKNAAKQAAPVGGQLPNSIAASSVQQTLQLPPPDPVPVHPTVAGMVRRNKKTLFRIQTAVGISKRNALRNLYRWGLPPLQKPRRPMLLPSKAFHVQDFTALQYTGTRVPTLPFASHSKYMYRGLGLALNGKAVRNILQNGLLLKDVGPHSNDRRMAFASSGGLGAMRAILKESVINLTDSPETAFHYAFRNKEKGMAVLVSVKETKNRGNIVTVPHDIPAAQINELAALVQMNGKPVWCRVELEGDGFRLTPYSAPQQTKKP